MKHIYLYKISFPGFTHKVYIGQTNDDERRWSDHKRDARNGSKFAIHSAMRKYGTENAIFEIIANCLGYTKESGNLAEIVLIEQYNSFKNGYNMTPGGEGLGCGQNHPNFGKHHTKKSKKKIGIANSGINSPHFGMFGYNHKSSKVWRLYFKNGQSKIINNLNQWSKKNGYSQVSISQVYKGKIKYHKDIIKVTQINS